LIIKLIGNLFDSGQFVPHGHCYLWNPYLVGLHIVGDLLIALAYYSIPVMLFYFVQKRQDVPFQGIFLLFGAFIVSCGTTHLIEIWTLWHPAYWLSGGLKIITAAVSLYTASELFDLIPKALVLLSPAQWELANQKLSQEILDRQQSDERLRQSRDELGERVNERTKELTVANILLQEEIFERRQAEEYLRHSEERYRSLIIATTQINWTNSADGRMSGEQPSWSAFTGQSYEEYQNFGWSEVVHPDDVERTLASWNKAVSTQSLCEMEHRVCRHDGEYRYFSVRATAVLNADGSTREWVGAHTDITDRRRAEIALRESEQRLDWYSRHDVLTGLINRWEFEQHLKQALSSAKTYNQQHSLCFLDLDQFKIVNDTCGHAAGDELLCQVTALLQKQVRTTDTLARLGGDEFGLLLNQCPLTQSLRIANDLRQSLQEFRFIWQDKTFTIGVSIGLVVIDVNTLDLSSVLSAADMACYAAKNAGRNRVHLYQADDQDLAISHGQMQWVSRLTEALQSNFFCLYSQPIVPLAPAELQEKHYEILLRLQDETGKLVPPMAFIPAAERYNLMHLIDRWVISTFFARFDQHCQETGQCWLELCCSTMYAINLSGASINDDCFIDFLEQQFTLYSVPPQLICFEITETVAIINLSKASKLIRKLKQLGCRFALDDFGSGMSSFAYLKNLSVDYLKIDGEFIKDIIDDPTDLAMTQAINQVGHAMGIKTIAEFVENDTILGIITALGIDYAQGYGIAKPQPLQFNS
jgi:diguanylate cyclase (GGDEF)-like protein/PAS domain S-box-containing protein